MERIPATGNKELKALLERAKAKFIPELAAAIEAELALRGAVELDTSAAERHAAWSQRAAGLDLTEAIQMAFTEWRINPEERSLILHIARNPGVGYQALVSFHGNGGVSLVLGHMVYERLGFFRRFLDGSGRMSDLLFIRNDNGGKVAYRLTPEAETAFTTLGLFDAVA